MNIYLYRHGKTAYTEEKRYQGRLDVPLSAEGERTLHKAPFEAETVYVSPLQRARQSARILFPTAKQEIVADFAEMDFGAFEGRSYIEMEHDAAYRAWVDGGCEGRCPGGEDRAAFCARTRAAFEKLLEERDRQAETLVIVAHGGTLRAVMSAYALPERGYFAWNTPCGGGYALAWDAELWRGKRKLRLLEEIAC